MIHLPRRSTNVSAIAARDGSPAVPVVWARGLGKTYRTGPVTVDALNGVDVRVERGDLVAIMGPSGCGKTTLLNCLAGLEAGFSGEVVIDGVSLRTLSD